MRAVDILLFCVLIGPGITPSAIADEGLTRGFMAVRVLEDRLLDALRFEALAAGRDPGDLYPGAGPIALAVVPVARLNVAEVFAVLPLLCEATVRRDPEQWSQYSQVRFLNRHAYTGYLFTDLSESCTRLRAGDDPLQVTLLGDRIVIGEWDARYLWRLATPIGPIGYGGYLGK